jgi:hypothetical protein
VTGADRDDIADQVRNQAINLLDSGVPATCGNVSQRICVEWFDGPNNAGEVGSYVRVTVRYDHGFVTPLDSGPFGMLGFPAHMNIDSCAIGRLERPASPPSSARRSGTPSC